MPPKPNPARRDELEAAVAEYVLAHGISGLSLRPLADALCVSTYSLVYHFGSKDKLIAAVLGRIEQRQRDMVTSWADEGENSPAATMRRYWREWCLPEEYAPYHRLFYETYALGLRHPDHLGDLPSRTAHAWLGLVREGAERAGFPPAEAEAVAWVMVSTIAGALLTMLGTRDSEAATRAVERVARQIEAGMPDKAGS